MIKVYKKQNLFGKLSVEGDKSITIRAIILGALSSGKTVILNPLISSDTLATLECVQKLGATVKKSDNVIEILGAKRLNDGCVLDCKNSGTLARFLIGALSGAGVCATIMGDESLSKRPMDRVCIPLKERGADIIDSDGKLPVYIKPAKLKECEYNMPIDSAQVKSALLLSGITSGVKTVVIEKNHTRDHTEKLIKHFNGNIAINNKEITLEKSQLIGCKVEVPNDPSSSAYYLAMGLCLGEITVDNLLISPERSGFFDKIKSANGKIRYANESKAGGFEIASITAYKSELNYFEVENNEIPSLIDEIPILALLGGINNGCKIKGAGELKLKESDRLCETVKLLNLVGIRAEQNNNGDLIVFKGENFKTFEYESDDHRMFMTAFCASTILADSKLKGESCVDISFSKFIKNYENLQMGLIGKSVSQSFSGSIHKFILSAYGQDNFIYEQRSINENMFDDFIKKCPYKAFNATSPFKERLFNCLKERDENTILAQSLNFVYNNKGYSTDGMGLCFALKYSGYNVKDKSVLVYGAGGAGKSISLALSKAGAKVYLLNRTQSKAEQFCKTNSDIKVFSGEKCDILINATTNKSELLFSEEILKQANLIIDINYGQELALESYAKTQNKPFLKGFSMLFFQAYLCDMIIINKQPNYQKAFKLFDEYRKNYEN